MSWSVMGDERSACDTIPLSRWTCVFGGQLTVRSGHSLELALWSALRALEEKLFAQRTLKRAKASNLGKAAEQLERRAAEAEHQANIIRQFLLNRKQDEAMQDSV